MWSSIYMQMIPSSTQLLLPLVILWMSARVLSSSFSFFQFVHKMYYRLVFKLLKEWQFKKSLIIDIWVCDWWSTVLCNSHWSSAEKNWRLLRFYYRNQPCLNTAERKIRVQTTFLPVLGFGDVLYMNAASSAIHRMDAVHHKTLSDPSLWTVLSAFMAFIQPQTTEIQAIFNLQGHSGKTVVILMPSPANSRYNSHS